MKRQSYVHIVLLILVYITRIVDGTHFRGSMISWRVLNDTASPLVVQILQRHAWRYTFYTPFCNESTITNGQPILGSNGYDLVCSSNCPPGLTLLGSTKVPCTGYNIGEQYAMGEGRFTVRVPQNSSFTAKFANVAWFALVTGVNLPWSVAVTILTYRRNDTKRYNNAPVITMLPIYRLRRNFSYSIKINVADNDFDPYICLWSKGNEQCGGLSNSVPGGVVDNYRCYVNFTPPAVGFYAVAVTVEDFIVLPTNISATNYLSQIPIQFIFHVYDSPYPCYTGPIYIGDLVPDICIHIPMGIAYTTRVRFKVRCPNTTVESVISVNPTGLLTTPVQQDPLDPTIFVFLANFTSNSDQIGQNLFCFAAVDSIGNQGDSACLRFAVASETSSLQPLYMYNETRFPMGTVSKTTSTWTILTGSRTFVRPATESYIRFKRVSNGSDYYILNVATELDRVLYLRDRLIINSSVIWLPGEYFYIFFDPGVFVEASTCTKESMPISDPKFWPFDIPYETTTTTTTSTTSTSATFTTTERTTPTRRTTGVATTRTSTSTTSSTTATTTITSITTSTVRTTFHLPIGGIIGIVLAGLCICAGLLWFIVSYIRVRLIRHLLLDSGLRQQFFSTTSESAPRLPHRVSNADIATSTVQYKLATRFRRRESGAKYSMISGVSSVQENLVEIRI